MKLKIIKILFLLLTPILALFSVSAVSAASFLYISPATLTVDSGSTIIASVGVSTSGNKICAIEGTIIFNNLTCQNITLANGLMVQTQPTCSNPNFIIGIPKCTTIDTTLFTITTKAGEAGVSYIDFSEVDLIGEGSSVGTASIKANYTIKKDMPVESVSNSSEQKVFNTDEEILSEFFETTEQRPEILTTIETDINQPAAISEISNINLLFDWIWKNIVWILFIIIIAASSFIIGRKTCNM